METVFLTGGNGLVGTRLIRAMCRRGGRLIALDRSGALPDKLRGESGAFEVVHGDLLRPETYAGALSGVDTVVHLAAATGNADKETHFRVNTEGTRILLEQARRAGTRRFLYVSSIAAKFRDKTRYFYAQSKELAEQAVEASGLPFLNIRPTIIAAPGAGALMALQRLADLPVIPVPGTGKARVQPIYVDDLVDCIIELVASELQDQTVEIGGPQALAIEDLLQEIRRLRRGAPGRVVHLPLGALATVLGIAESLGVRKLPVTPGQLASFRSDGVADNAVLRENLPSEMKTIAEMLKLSLVT